MSTLQDPKKKFQRKFLIKSLTKKSEICRILDFYAKIFHTHLNKCALFLSKLQLFSMVKEISHAFALEFFSTQ